METIKQVVILAGGKGTRMREMTEDLPKPMVKIGGIPVIEHLIRIFENNGNYNYLICTGYLEEYIFDYFKNWRKVILIRNPEEVLNKYLSRDNDILIHNNEYRLKLLDQIKNWNNGWKNETNSIIINKSDLVNNTFVTLKKIEEFLEIKFSIKNDFILPKIL